jgi:signal peptidase I
VIGLPGDRIQASAATDPPVVRIKPAGEETVYVVDNPAWSGRVGDKIEPCCAEDGTTLPRDREPGWVTVPDGQLWLVGDNWGGSDDSRTFGFIAQDQVTARISFRVQPLGELGGLPDEVSLVPED